MSSELKKPEVKLPYEKKCNCCNTVHTHVNPSLIKESPCDKIIGFYFDCSCGSTMFINKKKVA